MCLVSGRIFRAHADCYGRVRTFADRTVCEEPEIIEIGARGLQITAVSYFFSGLVYTYKAMLNGAGDAEFSLGNGVIEIVARILFILILSSIPAVGYWSVWIAAIFSSMLAASLCIWRYRSGKWMRKSAI